MGSSSRTAQPLDTARFFTEIAAARQGRWSILLTWTRPVPAEWFPPLPGKTVLCLASGGGQQGPILAAAGANVTVLDLSPRRLAQDRLVAERECLDLTLVEGDMSNLSIFEDCMFDLVVNPTSTMYVPEVRPVWREALRVLRPGGILMAGFLNPAMYAFDEGLAGQGIFQLRHPLPYSDVASLEAEELERLIAAGDTLQFSHTLADLIGGQLDAGFALTGLYEDSRPGSALSRYRPTHLATCAVKLPSTPEGQA